CVRTWAASVGCSKTRRLEERGGAFVKAEQARGGLSALESVTRNSVDVLPAGELERKLAKGRPLRVKLGVDPTSPDVHLGFAVVLDRLREWQDAGHTVVLIVGDYTARIGDPSGRSAERPVLSDEVLDANAKRFREQVVRVLDPE